MGDANRDRSVAKFDFNILATNFGTSGKNFSQANFSYDAPDSVDTVDFNLLASRFSKSLPQFAGAALPPMPVAAPLALSPGSQATFSDTPVRPKALGSGRSSEPRPIESVRLLDAPSIHPQPVSRTSSSPSRPGACGGASKTSPKSPTDLIIGL